MSKGITALMVLVLFAAFIPADVAEGHAKLVRARPAAGSTLTVPPTEVRLEFTLSRNEELDVRRSAIKVLDAKGQRVDDGAGGVDLDDLDRRTLFAKLKPLGIGTYTVRWQAVSSPDLNVARGSFTFKVVAGTRSATP